MSRRILYSQYQRAASHVRQENARGRQHRCWRCRVRPTPPTRTLHRQCHLARFSLKDNLQEAPPPERKRRRAQAKLRGRRLSTTLSRKRISHWITGRCTWRARCDFFGECTAVNNTDSKHFSDIFRNFGQHANKSK